MWPRSNRMSPIYVLNKCSGRGRRQPHWPCCVCWATIRFLCGKMNERRATPRRTNLSKHSNCESTFIRWKGEMGGRRKHENQRPTTRTITICVRRLVTAAAAAARFGQYLRWRRRRVKSLFAVRTKRVLFWMRNSGISSRSFDCRNVWRNRWLLLNGRLPNRLSIERWKQFGRPSTSAVNCFSSRKVKMSFRRLLQWLLHRWRKSESRMMGNWWPPCRTMAESCCWTRNSSCGIHWPIHQLAIRQRFYAQTTINRCERQIER